jgi:hypothetical protein
MFSDQQKEDAERVGFCYPQILQIDTDLKRDRGM